MNTFLNFKLEGFTNYYSTGNLHLDINRRGNWEINHCRNTGDKEAAKRSARATMVNFRRFENFFKCQSNTLYKELSK
jgi:hypothetical protein